MRKITLLLGAYLISVTTATYAGLETFEKPLVINGATYKIIKNIETENVSIKVVDKDSKDVWASKPLGYAPWNFKINGKATSLEIEDLDGDNIPEIITACATGEIQSALYIFKYNPENKDFIPMNFGYEKYKGLERDFMVSDIPYPNGENMVFETNNKIRCLGKKYQLGEEPAPAYYYFELKNGVFLAGDPVIAKIENILSTHTDNKE